VLANQGLVRKLIIAKYGKGAAHDEDLRQAGLVGLCIAVAAFEQQRITGRFSSYARTCIIEQLAKCSLASGRRVIPHRRFYERIEIQRHAQSLAHVLGRDPTPAEIVESWPGPRRRPWLPAVERALQPDPVLVVEETRDVNQDVDVDEVDIEDLIDAKRRFERLSPAEQEQLRGGRRG
jgi:DNA-directed RNA polymerase sigma subunit (sigma70/sigma32)